VPRKLKTYQTAIGFFELAIAAPSMKTALEAWGAKSNLFHQGFAKEARDSAIIAATMAKPGVVLRRAVGSNDSFKEKAGLPRDLGVHAAEETATKATPRTLDAKATAAAALAFEREETRREQKRQKEVTGREKQRKQRELAVAKSETALEEAWRTHETKVEEIEVARSALDRKLQAEDARWQKERAKLEAKLDRAQE
jgi:colicin import membrane protein